MVKYNDYRDEYKEGDWKVHNLTQRSFTTLQEVANEYEDQLILLHSSGQ